MASEPARESGLVRFVELAAIGVTSLVMVLAAGLLIAETTWVEAPQWASNQDAFLHASAGTELLPKAVLLALPELFPENFQPGGPEAGDWMQQFGFIPGKEAGVPMGFFTSRFRPRSGAPSPVEFVGPNCSLCHSSLIRRYPGDDGVLVLGMGNQSLDFIGWFDAFKASVLDGRLTVEAIGRVYEEKTGKTLGAFDRGFIGLWLRGLRRTFVQNFPQFDEPYRGPQLRDSRLMPSGPSRTQPFRNLVRAIIKRPAGATDKGYSKFPSLYEQKDRQWGQYDGSVRDRVSRSVMAAVATGATKTNLVVPGITDGVLKAIQFTVDLPAPKYEEIFADQGFAVDLAAAERGRALYLQYCEDCHGHRDTGDGSWVQGRRHGEVIAATELGTDPERVEFRYYDVLGDYIVDYFPEGHPLRPKREEIRPGPAGRVHGYINAPIEGAFSRAPFLHNGSVLTLAELINLKPRRQLFYRGDHVYDPVDLGWIAPAEPDPQHYWRFDTRVEGNSAAGHDYPWAYRGPGWDEAALRDLLEYLKTL